MLTATIKLIKNKAKTNVSGSTSYNEDGTFRSFNFTGKLVALEGFTTKDGVNYDKELVQIDCPTTILVSSETMGQAIYDRCGEIFAKRASEGDLNPAVDLVVDARTLRPRETNILITNIKHSRVEADTQLVDNSTDVEDVLAKLKANSAARANNSNNTVQAARAGASNLAKAGLNLIKRSF
jgi:hypothetical protein